MQTSRAVVAPVSRCEGATRPRQPHFLAEPTRERPLSASFRRERRDAGSGELTHAQHPPRGGSPQRLDRRGV